MDLTQIGMFALGSFATVMFLGGTKRVMRGIRRLVNTRQDRVAKKMAADEAEWIAFRTALVSGQVTVFYANVRFWKCSRELLLKGPNGMFWRSNNPLNADVKSTNIDALVRDAFRGGHFGCTYFDCSHKREMRRRIKHFARRIRTDESIAVLMEHCERNYVYLKMRPATDAILPFKLRQA